MGMIKVATMHGEKAVETSAVHGLYAVHRSGAEFVVTHVPTGCSLYRYDKKAMAIACAKYMHAHAGDTGANLPFAASWHAAKARETLTKILDVLHSFEREHGRRRRSRNGKRTRRTRVST